MRARTLVGACAAALMALSASPAAADRAIDESLQAHPRGEVEISNLAGSVEVTGWDEERVRVTGRLGDDVERLEFTGDGRYVLVKVIVPSGSRRSVDSDLRVSVPRGSRLNVGTVSADIRIEAVEGALRLQSVSGDVTADVFGEDAQVKSVSGDVVIEGRDQPALLTVTTVSGDAEVRNVAGEIVVQTVSGDLDASSPSVERARINTTNGDADFVTALASGARVEMETINGDLTLVIRGEVDAEFDLETFNGDIRTDFGPEPERTSRFAPGTELRFTEGEGSARVIMETLNGGIIIRND